MSAAAETLTHQAFECGECDNRTWVPLGVLSGFGVERLWCANHDAHGDEQGARMEPVPGKYVAL